MENKKELLAICEEIKESLDILEKHSQVIINAADAGLKDENFRWTALWTVQNFGTLAECLSGSLQMTVSDLMKEINK